MDYFDEFDDEFDDVAGSDDSFLQEWKKNDIDPLDISDPKSAYLYLSDDVQDELEGTSKRKMKCDSCGHMFWGDIIESCPICYNLDTRRVLPVVPLLITKNNI